MNEEILVEIPKAVENLNLPAPELITFYKNLENRVLWIDQDIDISLLEYSKYIMRWNKEDELASLSIESRVPIKLFIFTHGGEIDACFNLLDICALSKTPIITVNMGNAFSAGLLLLSIGHKRYTLSKASAMVHSGSGGFNGTYEQTKAQMDLYNKIVKMMENYVLERTKIDQKTFNKHKKDDWYLTAEEQVEYGIVDAIVTDLSQIM